MNFLRFLFLVLFVCCTILLNTVDGQEKSNRIVVNSDLGKENDYNDFGQPEKVNIKKFSSFSVKNNILKIDLPSKSVVTIELKK